MQKYYGTGVAVITPFKKDQTVDFTALANIIDNLLQNNIDYLVALGTTSEAPALSGNEKMEIIHFFIDRIEGKVPLVIGSGGNNTAEVINFINNVADLNFEGFLSVCPYYNKPGQNALYHHFEAIADNTHKDIIVYNVPSRTGCNLLPETTAKLATDFNNIVALKDAAGSLTQTMETVELMPDDFTLISGDDVLAIAQIAVGAKGLISVSANAIPQHMANLVNAALSYDFDSAKAIHYQFQNLHRLIFEEGNPTGIKCLMSQMELCENILRLPLIKASEKLSVSLNSIVKDIFYTA